MGALQAWYLGTRVAKSRDSTGIRGVQEECLFTLLFVAGPTWNMALTWQKAISVKLVFISFVGSSSHGIPEAARGM